MINYAFAVTVAALMILAMLSATVGVYFERLRSQNRSGKIIEDDRYYIKGDGMAEAIPLPYSWTLGDAYFLRDLLRDKYIVGCVILYGNDERKVEI